MSREICGGSRNPNGGMRIHVRGADSHLQLMSLPPACGLPCGERLVRSAACFLCRWIWERRDELQMRAIIRGASAILRRTIPQLAFVQDCGTRIHGTFRLLSLMLIPGAITHRRGRRNA